MKKKVLIDYAVIALGSIILALAINMFLVPVKISTGGVSGAGTVLLYLFKIPMSVSTLIINMVLFIFGYKMLPKSSIVKTLVGIVTLSAALEITNYLPKYSADMLISAVFGGVLVGIGVGLAVSRDASTGGSDFAALMINRLCPHLSVASIIMVIDSSIIILSGIVFKDYTIMFYSVLSLYISTKVTDLLMIQSDFAKSVQIVSDKSEEIADRVMEEMERGVTGIYSRGLYRSEDKVMLLCVVRSRELPRLLSIIKGIDKSAFIIISEVRQVLGEGFREE